jgi:hypothetical protein
MGNFTSMRGAGLHQRLPSDDILSVAALLARRVLGERARTTQHLALLTHNCHNVAVGSNVDSRKPHQPSSFHDSIPRASEPELTLVLVHSRTPLAPLDTVRALSPGRGRQSSAQGFTFSTAGTQRITDSLCGPPRAMRLVAYWPSPRQKRSQIRQKDRPVPHRFIFQAMLLLSEHRSYLRRSSWLAISVGPTRELTVVSS